MALPFGKASIDTTRPSGSLVLSKDPAYVREGGDTPFGSGYWHIPNLTFGDIDNDGDLDLFIGALDTVTPSSSATLAQEHSCLHNKRKVAFRD